MPSPFPGMNPYLERETVWSDFRLTFIVMTLQHIVAQLPNRYAVQIGTREYIHEVPPERKHLDVPDVEKVRYLYVRHLETDEIVTVIELLSPTNKYAGPDREQYLGKRYELLRSRTHLVEIDLLRGGPRMPPDDLPTCDYCAIVSRVEERPTAGV